MACGPVFGLVFLVAFEESVVSEQRVVIVGGGVIGVCCAYFLAKRGAAVTLVERDEIGKGASYGNAGTIAAGHPPLNKPGRIRRSLKQLLDPRSPLYIAPRWDPGLARWLWAFRKHCTESRLAASTAALAPLGHASLELFDALVEQEELDCGYSRGGYYEVCHTVEGLEEVERDAASMREHGYHPRTLSGPELVEEEPALIDGPVGGVHFPDAATCDPYLFVLEMADRARRHGGSVLTGRAVDEVVSEAGRVKGVRLRDGEVLEAESVVLATGAYSRRLTEKLGVSLPIQAGKGYHRDLANGAGEGPLLGVTCVLSETSVFCTPMGGFTRLAGTMEFSGVNHELRRGRLEQLSNAAGAHLAGASDAVVSSEWCGLRPCTPDGLPFVGPVPGQDGLFVANGHAMLGLTLAPVTGTLIAEHVLDGETRLPSGALGLDRL